MNFDDNDRVDASQVEDRRGMSLGGGLGMAGGGLGLIGLLIFGAIRLLGGGLEVEPSRVSRGPSQPSQPGQPATAQTPGGSCKGASASRDQGQFVACVQSNVQQFWTQKLQGYNPATMVLFTDATQSGCGYASAATGPFYCPRDEKVYLDTGFFDELHRRFHARGGDFAEAYVVAHEYGHHVQRLRGVEGRVREAQSRDRERANEYSVALELQADCYAGVWGHAAYEKGKVEDHEISQAIDAAAAVGDDRIQKATTGQVRPERFTHGTAAQRVEWFRRGLDSGDPRQCDTFPTR